MIKMEYEQITESVLKDSEGKGRRMGYYDFISNNGHKFSNDELIRFIKEIDYAMYCNLDVSDYNAIIEYSLETLQEYYVDDNITVDDIETELE